MKEHNAQPIERTGGQILVDQLKTRGTEHVFLVPGESYLAVLDALHDAPIQVTVCRQEGGAAMMAEASGKLTGRPGICFVTRGPGATNASPGIHIARQDSTPMILFVGQVERGMRGREAFQEVDYRATFTPIAKWATEIDDPARIPEIVARAFAVATAGRPGPVVIGLPEDMLRETAAVADAKPCSRSASSPAAKDLQRVGDLLAAARQPLVIAGGSTWRTGDDLALARFAETFSLPVATSFRRQTLLSNDHPNYAGDLGVGCNPKLLDYARTSDLVLLLGGRLSEIPSQGYELFEVPTPTQHFIHVHPGAEELNSVYQSDVVMNVTPGAFLDAISAIAPPPASDRGTEIRRLNEIWRQWSGDSPQAPGDFDLGDVIRWLSGRLPDEAVICNGAGNYATWVHRFYRYRHPHSQLAPTSGSMGYGVPAAVAAARLDPSRLAVAFAGDGCFLMNGQEFATAVQYDLPVVVIVVDNGMFGTIRMHQERNYPGRISGTGLKNPDFAALARAYGGHGERVERTGDFPEAFERALASGKPAILHCVTDPEALTVNHSLSAIRAAAIDGGNAR